MNRSSVTPVLAVIWISLLAGCSFINSINPLAKEETPPPPQPVAGAPANPGAAPADPNAAGAPAQAPASVPNVPPSQTPFRDAVNKAMSTAEAVQTAKSQEEWQAVVTGWQEAIALMQQVPAGDANHATAQAKVTEYTGNLNYAKANAGQ